MIDDILDLVNVDNIRGRLYFSLILLDMDSINFIYKNLFDIIFMQVEFMTNRRITYSCRNREV